MSITFQKPAEQSNEQDSAGSLLLGAIFGGLTSEIGQAVDMAYDAAEVASEFHTHYSQKANNDNFKLGQKNSLNSMFSNRALGITEEKPDLQKRYLTMDYTPAPQMRMAA